MISIYTIELGSVNSLEIADEYVIVINRARRDVEPTLSWIVLFVLNRATQRICRRLSSL